MMPDVPKTLKSLKQVRNGILRVSKNDAISGLERELPYPSPPSSLPPALQLSGKRLKVAQLDNQNANDHSILFSLKREREATRSRKARVTRDLME